MFWTLVVPAVIVFAAVIILFICVELWIVTVPAIEISASATRAEKLDTLNQWFDSLEDKEKFNGTILYAENGEVVFRRNVGFADKAETRKISDQTSFNLASVTKHMTAFAILILAHEGKLKRTDPVTKYLPELNQFQNVTLDHLLYHTSGIPDYVRMSKKQLDGHRFLTPALLISQLKTEKTAVQFSPGTEEEYSNINYVLLAEVIARISEASFATFMQERIFEPLEMHDSAIVNQFENTDFLKDRAYGFRKKYIYFGRNAAFDLNHLDGVTGDGSAYSTADDLVKWDTSLRNGTLLPADLYAEAYTPHRLNNGEISTKSVWGTKLQSGLGWNVQDLPFVNSYGAWRGFSNFYGRNLECKSVLIVLSNSGVFVRTAAIAEKLTEFTDHL